MRGLFDVEKVAQFYGATEIITLRSGNFLFREGDEIADASSM